MEQLYKTILERKRPEDVAQMILDIIGNDLDKKEKTLLEKAASNSLKNSLYGYTSMAQEFAKPVGAKRQIDKAIELFVLQADKAFEYDNIENIQLFINQVSALLGKAVGNNNFLADRKNKLERESDGIDYSKRAYNKRWRLLKRLEKKLEKYIRECSKVEFQQIAKHGIAHHISYDEFSDNINSACFIAYYTARCNLRSQFTIGGQERPFDTISEMLLNRCKANDSNTNWWAIAHVYPSTEVLSMLTDEQKGILLGKWTTILQNIATLLKEVWEASVINRDTMIVRLGNDSSTWNNTAGAWNKARDSWMNLIYAMGAEFVLDNMCFGKVMRLMAGDIVYWNLSNGGTLDPSTSVWNELPLPWEVFEGKATCNRVQIKNLCNKYKIDAEKTGWIAPRQHSVVPYTPTPELVHGVTVHNPFLATILKKRGYFSGKACKQ